MKKATLSLVVLLALLLIAPVFFKTEVFGAQESSVDLPSVQSSNDSSWVSLYQQLKDKGLDETQIAAELKKIIEGDIDLVGQKIQELRQKGLNDTEIVAELEKIGMHWNIAQNTTSIGIPDVSSNDPRQIALGRTTLDWQNGDHYREQRDARLHTDSQSYAGFYIEMKPGGCAMASGETHYHYITMHLGNSGKWVEVGVHRDDSGNFNYFSWDEYNTTTHKETYGGQFGLGYPDADTYHRYALYLTGNQNGSGWYEYRIDIDGTRVRTGYVQFSLGDVDNSHEYFTEEVVYPAQPPCVWSNDNNPSLYRDQYVKSNGNWVQWTNQSASSHSYAHFAKQGVAYESGGSFSFKTWSGFGDEFYDNSIATSRWDELEVNGGAASEYSEALRLYVPQGSGWGHAGYVTKATYSMWGAQAEVTTNDFNEVQEMALYIGLTKTTTSNPYDESNWYRFMKSRSDGNIYIQRKVNGALTTLYVGSSGMTGTLKIRVSGGTITFYNTDSQVYSESYSLSSSNCYLYAFVSSYRPSYYGTDVFDDFEYHLLGL